MKILVTLDFPPEIGGIQRYLFDIVRHTYGHEDLVLAGCRRPISGECVEAGARVAWLSTPFSRWNKKISLLPLLWKYVEYVFPKSELFDVECGNVYAAIVPWIARFITGINYSVYTHGTELLFLRKASVRGSLLRKILGKSQKILANSAYTAALVKEAGFLNEISIVSPKIDLPRKSGEGAVPRKTRKEADTPVNSIDILCVGRLVPHKGHSVLLDAVSMLPGNKSWRLVIAGNGPLYKDLIDLCEEKNIKKNVQFKNDISREELEREYEKAALFVLPSLERIDGVEGFGIVLLEAMAYGVPIIASCVGGVPEVLDDGACGILVEAGNSVALAHAILALNDDAPKRRGLIAAAHERVRTHYAW
jgi:glycosyltransferase involved in cell wall biosynthesis